MNLLHFGGSGSGSGGSDTKLHRSHILGLTHERRDEGSRRNNIGEQQEEDGERQQDGDAERDFLATVGRQIKDAGRESRDADARDDQVDHEVERLTTNHHRHRDVQVGIRAARVDIAVPGEKNRKIV